MEETVIQRIKDVIASKDLNPRSFSLLIDFNYKTLNGYLNGKRSAIDVSLLSKTISSFKDISARWLLTGTGDMFECGVINREEKPDETESLKNKIMMLEDKLKDKDEMIEHTLKLKFRKRCDIYLKNTRVRIGYLTFQSYTARRRTSVVIQIRE